jgi:catalase (peroxidase I)
MAIQTGRGLVYQAPDGTLIKRNLSPVDAAKEARRMFANLRFEDLTSEQTLAAMGAAAKICGVKGAAIHNFMHARTAELKKAQSIVTLNHADFSRMTKLPLELPVKNLGI